MLPFEDYFGDNEPDDSSDGMDGTEPYVGNPCTLLMRNFARRSPSNSRNSAIGRFDTSCMRINMEAATGKRRCRILLIIGGATSNALDRAASFFNFSLSSIASSNLSGSYSDRSYISALIHDYPHFRRISILKCNDSLNLCVVITQTNDDAICARQGPKTGKCGLIVGIRKLRKQEGGWSPVRCLFQYACLP